MYISTVYLSTYTQETPISGHMDIIQDGVSTKIQFSEKDARTIQDLCVAAFLKERDKIVASLLSDTPAVKALPAPVHVEEAEFVADEMPF